MVSTVKENFGYTVDDLSFPRNRRIVSSRLHEPIPDARFTPVDVVVDYQ
jgi:hypothetical protein